MKKILFIVTLFLLCGAKITAQAKISENEYQIYARVLEQTYKIPEQYAAVTNIPILNETIKPSRIVVDELMSGKLKVNIIAPDKLPAEAFQNDFKTALEDSVKNNLSAAKIKFALPTIYKYSIVSDSEIRSLLVQGYDQAVAYYKTCHYPCPEHPFTWGLFLKKYPNLAGYYSFSRAGFNRTRTVAVVYSRSFRGDKYYWDLSVLSMTVRGWEIYARIGGGWIKSGTFMYKPDSQPPTNLSF